MLCSFSFILFYAFYFRCYKVFITVNRWNYDPERRLHQDCKTPQKSDVDLTKYLLKEKGNETKPVVSIIKTVPKKPPPAKIKTNKQPAPLAAGKRKAVKVSEQLEEPELAKTASAPKLQRVDTEDSRLLAEQASLICELRAGIKKYETENLSKMQASSSSFSNSKLPDIYEFNNSATSMPVHYDTHSTNRQQQPSSNYMVTLFEYEMRLQQIRASADVDRMKAEARMDYERLKSEQERSRAEISEMKLRMFYALNR